MVPSILVIGSSNTDMVVRVADLPSPGQTVLGGEFGLFAGGKGANQAVAARRAGGEVRFLGVLGQDDFGDKALSLLNNEGIDTSLIRRVDDVASGVALITVAASGENCIAVAPGANALLTVSHVEEQVAEIAQADILLLQLESPLDAVAAAIKCAASQGTRCVLNPAPAATLTDELLADLYCITPNETEAELLTGIAVVDTDSAVAAAEKLLQRGVKNVIITRGAAGALLANDQSHYVATAPVVETVDTTAAGDTFNGVLVTALAEGQSLRQATELAVAAASIAVQSSGAIPSIPLRTRFDPDYRFDPSFL